MDKKPLKSKKFIAFFFSMLLVAGILITALITQSFGWAMSAFMVAGMFTIGFLSVGYIFSQKALDKFIAGMDVLGGEKSKEEDNVS